MNVYDLTRTLYSYGRKILCTCRRKQPWFAREIPVRTNASDLAVYTRFLRPRPGTSDGFARAPIVTHHAVTQRFVRRKTTRDGKFRARRSHGTRTCVGVYIVKQPNYNNCGTGWKVPVRPHGGTTHLRPEPTITVQLTYEEIRPTCARAARVRITICLRVPDTARIGGNG
jgi:hypothetical protein